MEEGNAYRTEKWPGNGAAHQREVSRLFQLLAASIGYGDDWTSLMDGVLTANFCPFRSSSWEALEKKKEAVDFSLSFWRELWKHLSPDLIFCNGGQSYEVFAQVLAQTKAKNTQCDQISSGWGNTTYEIEFWKNSGKAIALVKLPHLSRFKTMSSDGCAKGRQQLINRLARFLIQSQSVSKSETESKKKRGRKLAPLVKEKRATGRDSSLAGKTKEQLEIKLKALLDFPLRIEVGGDGWVVNTSPLNTPLPGQCKKLVGVKRQVNGALISIARTGFVDCGITRAESFFGTTFSEKGGYMMLRVQKPLDASDIAPVVAEWLKSYVRSHRF